MTTLAYIKKMAKDNLTPFLKEKGFKIVNTFDFIKEGPEKIYYAIYPIINRGVNLKVLVVCHTDEMQQLIAYRFPKCVSNMVGGYLKPGCPIAYENRYIWDVRNQGIINTWEVGENDMIRVKQIDTNEDVPKALKEIKACIEESALPFFDSITDRKKLVDFIYPSLRKGNYAVVIEKILAWRPEDNQGDTGSLLISP